MNAGVPTRVPATVSEDFPSEGGMRGLSWCVSSTAAPGLPRAVLDLVTRNREGLLLCRVQHGPHGRRCRTIILGKASQERLGQPPVHHQGLSELPEHDVGWFQVAVEHTSTVA